MIKSNRFTTGLSGASPVDSVYSVPDVDPAYAVANLHYNNVPYGASEFQTASLFYDPNRPVGPTNRPSNPATGETEDSGDGENRSLIGRIFFDPWNLFGNDGAEANEQPIDNANVKADDKFAITALGFIFAGFIVARVIK